MGFTTLSERRDPEEIRELLTRYFDTALDVISRYGGVVEKFIGDAVMAVWGTPVAHEDDPERAVRAALELVDAVTALGTEIGSHDLRVRAGVLTGEAAVTVGAQGQGMVAGDLVNTASRLQSAAAPGSVLVGESTYHAAKKAIAFDNEGEHTLKGKALPVKAWRATRVVAGHQGFRKSEGLEPPFVGRERELRLVKDLLHAVGSEKKPRLVSMVGIGGIGKSRLAWELFKYIDGLVDTIYWHQGRSPAYGEGVTFWALGEMVRMRCRIAETEEASPSRAKLGATLEDYIADPEERRWVEPRLAHLLGLEEGAPGEREELFAAWRTFFERVSDKGPTVMVFEDLQWADPGLIDFIEHILEWSRSHPILILTLSRPELMDKRPSWGAGQRNFTSLYLEPLTNDAMRQLLLGLACDLPEAALAQILSRAEGVPLYAVEMVRMLVDQGQLAREDGSYRLTGELSHLDIPDSLHGLIASRLDVLPAEDRALLQDAAVLGKTFTMGALGAVAGNAPSELEGRLKELVRKELLVVEADPRSPERGQYGFVQSLIREVAYSTLSHRDRVARHLSAAHFFEAAGDEELASVVASHYLEAYRAAPEGPEAQALVARAHDSLLTAAQRAGSLGAHGQALVYLDQALDVTTDAAERAALWEQAGIHARNAARYETAERYLERALEWHRDSGDQSAMSRVAASLSRILLSTGRNDEAVARLEAVATDLTLPELDPGVATLTAALAAAYASKYDTSRAIELADLALAAAERLDLVPVVLDALLTKGQALYARGRWREAVALSRGALALAEEVGLAFEQLHALRMLGVVLEDISVQQAFEAALHGFELARKLGLRDQELALGVNSCWAGFISGHWDVAQNIADELDSDELDSRDRTGFAISSASILAARGELDAAKQRLAGIASLIGESTDPTIKANFLQGESFVALSEGKVEEAYGKALSAGDADPRFAADAARPAALLGRREQLDQTLRRIEEAKIHNTWTDSCRHMVTGTLAALNHRPEEAVASFVNAMRGWRELGNTFELALCELSFVSVVTDDRAEARAATEEAREIFAGLGAEPFLARLDATRSSPELLQA